MERSSQARAKIDRVKKLKRLNTRSVVVLRSGVAWMRKMNVVTWLVFVTVLDIVVTAVRACPAGGCISSRHLRITVDGRGRPQQHDVPLPFSIPVQAQ